MKHLALIPVVVIALSGCVRVAEQPQSDVETHSVQKLFTQDGCSVYRFYDMKHSYRALYFTNCDGSVTWTQRSASTKTTQTISID